MVKNSERFFQRPNNQGGSWKIRKNPGLYAFELISFTMAMVKEKRNFIYRPGRNGDFQAEEEFLGPIGP